MAGMRTVAAATSLVFTLGLVCFVRPGFAQQPDSAGQRPDSSLTAEALKKLSIEQLMNLQGTSANKLLVLIDGRTVYTPLFSGVFWDVQEVPLQDIDRIEVISGPGATLWGANAVNGVINVITKDAKDTQGFLLSGGGGTEQHGFGAVRYGAPLGSSVRARIYGRRFDRDATTLPSGRDAADDWHLKQGGFRMDWEASSASRATLQGDLYDGRIAQDSGGDIGVNGRTVIGSDSTLAFLPLHVAREWFTAFVQDEIALVPNRVHVTVGTKIEHNDYTGFEIQPSGRVSWRPGSSGTLWMAVSRALRTPSRIDRELFAPAKPPYFLAGGADFHSEEELAYELGYRYQHGTLGLSVATFYSRYHGLRSVEQVNPPAPV